jgi:hypothetical protein
MDSGGKSLRRRCEARLRELEPPSAPGLSVSGFCDHLAARRGRGIIVRSMPSVGEGFACGLWVATDDADIVLVERGTTVQHQDHIVAHELGHICFDHYGTLHPTSHELGRLMPNLDPALVRRVLGRTSYTSREESEAEVFASVLMTYTTAGARLPGPAGSDAGQPVHRFASALEPDGVWRE